MSESNSLVKSSSGKDLRAGLTSSSKSQSYASKSPPLTSSPIPQPPQQDKRAKKDKNGNPDVLSFDLTMPPTELQGLATFGDPSSGNESTVSFYGDRPPSALIGSNSFAKKKTSSRARVGPDKPNYSTSTNGGNTSNTSNTTATTASNGNGENEGDVDQDTDNGEQKTEDAARTGGRSLSPSKSSRGLRVSMKDRNVTNDVILKRSGPVTVSDVQLFNRTAVNIVESINTLKVGLQDIEKAIKLDNDVISNYAVSLQQLEMKQQAILYKIKEKEDWLRKYSRNVQPLQEQIIGLYEKVGQMRASLSPQKSR